MVAFGISALALAIIAIVIPVIGYFVAGLSGFLAIFSAGKATSWGLAAVIINIVNIIFLSPSLLLMTSDEFSIDAAQQSQSKTIFTVLLVIQFIAICVFILKSIQAKK